MIIERRTHSVEETQDLAARFARHLVPGDIVALEGALGAGKTSFVRGMAAGLGVDPARVSSPTYVMAQEYEAGSRGPTLVHVDLYRMSDEAELETIGWEELLASEELILAVEWPSRVASDLPRLRTIDVDLEHEGETDRLIRFAVPQAKADRFKPLKPRTRPCPTCGRDVAIDRPDFPFCSERCRLADLGEWFEEKYRLSRPIDSSDELE